MILSPDISLDLNWKPADGTMREMIPKILV